MSKQTKDMILGKEDRGRICTKYILDGKALRNSFGGKLDVVGQIAGTNGPFSVKVDGENAVIFNNTNFWGTGRIKTGTNTISIVTSDASTNRNETFRQVTFPPTNPQQFTWDANGNLTGDGLRTYTWNEENRLIGAETLTNLPSSVPRKNLAFTSDYMSRRTSKSVYNWISNDWSAVASRTFIYDGWNLIQERSTLDALPSTNYYTWGLDLSGSRQGAGGIGGLVSVTRSTSSGTATYYPCYDANGNITDYVDTNGIVVAHREYDPFGNTIVATGPMVNDFSFWFSTKYLDQETGLYYYGYRYYSPGMGRWLARDPIGDWANILNLSSCLEPILDQLTNNQKEISPMETIMFWAEINQNLTQMAGNNPINNIDPFGLLTDSQCDALEKILKMEEEIGTHDTAREISNTWGKTGLLKEFNSDIAGQDSTVNGVDIDWFSDISSLTDASFPLLPTSAYVVGKTFWAIYRNIAGVSYNNNMLPFWEKEERAAVRKAELQRRYRDIITPEYLKKECPEKCK